MQKSVLRSRSRWSCFACLAATDIDFFRHLGYRDEQINEFFWEAEKIYTLAHMPLSNPGDVLAIDPPQLDAVSQNPGRFMLIPRALDAYLRFEAYVEDVPATPKGMKQVLELLISNGNYTYRSSILEQLWVEQLVWPESGSYDWIDADLGLAPRPTLIPKTIFPCSPYGLYDTVGVMLDVNTQRGIGCIKEINCEERNVFGFPTHQRFWNDYKRSHQRGDVRTMNNRRLGIPGQYCQITSGDMFLSRASMNDRTTSDPICALFLTSNPLNNYFPKNRLSSSITYTQLTFSVNSVYVPSGMVVTNEVYDVSLVVEIRNVY